MFKWIKSKNKDRVELPSSILGTYILKTDTNNPFDDIKIYVEVLDFKQGYVMYKFIPTYYFVKQHIIL